MSTSKTAIAASTLVFFSIAAAAAAQQRATPARIGASPSTIEQTAKQPTVDPRSPAQETITTAPRPQHNDPGGGGQGRQTVGDTVMPDLVLGEHFRLGAAVIGWGTGATVQASDAAATKLGACGFAYKYSTRNESAASAAASTNRIHRDTQNGPVVATNALPALSPWASSVSEGQLWLKPGTWTLYVHADGAQAVAESEEANNLGHVKVTVKGKCGQGTATLGK